MNTDTISIAYADDHKIVRKGIATFLNELGGIHVDIEADNGRDLIDQLKKKHIMPDICILDINMPVMGGFETLAGLRQLIPGIRVLVLTAFDVEMYIIRMISAGANGYLLKSSDPEEIKRAIEDIHTNGAYYSDKVTRSFCEAVKNGQKRLPLLTDNELQLLSYCCSDLSYNDIAVRMNTSPRSVAGYRDSIFRKLSINSRVSLALFATQFGLVPLDINNSDGNFVK